MLTKDQIIKTHNKTVRNSMENLTNKKILREKLKTENEMYKEADSKVIDMTGKLKMCEEELFSHISALNALVDLYTRIKNLLKKDLEDRLTDTVNTWYRENVDLEFKYQGTSSKTKNRAVKLIDKVKNVQLEKVTGDAACQTVGLLVTICIARMRGLKFVCLDEPFSNFSEESAKKVPELLESLIGDMQILLIENKETVLKEIDSYYYQLGKYEEHENLNGSKILRVGNEHLFKEISH